MASNLLVTLSENGVAKPITEHQLVSTEKDAFESKPLNLIHWEYPENNQAGYYTDYHLGAEWLDDTQPIVVVPQEKMLNLDFLSLFMHCFSIDDTDDFSDIYGISLDEPPVKSTVLPSVLSQLIVARYIQVISKIIRKGLLKQYVSREENLNKVKGRIHIAVNDRVNIRNRNYHKVFCQYNEYSIDNPVNGLLKRALLFCKELLLTAKSTSNLSFTLTMATINKQLSAFDGVNEDVNLSLQFKANKLYSGYKEAVILAKRILRRYDNSISNISETADEVPPFWIDMSLLYEHYAYSLMKEAYGNKILYQEVGYHDVKPDFLYKDVTEPYVLDTKYMPWISDDDKHITKDVERQLSGYARDKKLLGKMGVAADMLNSINVPCVVIYPVLSDYKENPFKTHPIKDLLQEETYYSNFYTLALPLPTINSQQ